MKLDNHTNDWVVKQPLNSKKMDLMKEFPEFVVNTEEQ